MPDAARTALLPMPGQQQEAGRAGQRLLRLAHGQYTVYPEMIDAWATATVGMCGVLAGAGKREQCQ